MEQADPIGVVAGLCAILAIVPALFLERRRRRLGIGTRPYAWAYFQGITSLLFGCAMLLASLFSGEPLGVLVGVAFFAVFSGTGLFVVKRRRWAWVVLSILCLNPISWIAHYIYGRNRWNELAGLPGSEAAVEPASLARVLRTSPTPSPVSRTGSTMHASASESSQIVPGATPHQHHADGDQGQRVELLERLAALHRVGSLTDEEFQDEKRRLLLDQG